MRWLPTTDKRRQTSFDFKWVDRRVCGKVFLFCFVLFYFVLFYFVLFCLFDVVVVVVVFFCYPLVLFLHWAFRRGEFLPSMHYFVTRPVDKVVFFTEKLGKFLFCFVCFVSTLHCSSNFAGFFYHWRHSVKTRINGQYSLRKHPDRQGRSQPLTPGWAW